MEHIPVYQLYEQQCKSPLYLWIAGITGSGSTRGTDVLQRVVNLLSTATVIWMTAASNSEGIKVM